MLQHISYQRLGPADIVGHPWMEYGEVASADQVRNEINRHNLKDKTACDKSEENNCTKWFTTKDYYRFA